MAVAVGVGAGAVGDGVGAVVGGLVVPPGVGEMGGIMESMPGSATQPEDTARQKTIPMEVRRTALFFLFITLP